jgi:hypothetical protein
MDAIFHQMFVFDSIGYPKWLHQSSIGDLLHWLNYSSIPITFPCFDRVPWRLIFSLVLNIAEKLLAGHGTSVLFTSHPKDGLVVNLYIPHNRRMPLQAEEVLGPISIPRGSRRVGPF